MHALLLEVLARGIAVGALCALGAGAWKADGLASARYAALLFVVSAAAYTIAAAPMLLAAFGPFGPALRLLGLGAPGLFWLFAVVLFDDRRLSWLRFLPYATLTSLGIAAQDMPALVPVRALLETGLTGHALGVVVSGWREDMVETRRNMRGPFLSAVALYILLLCLLALVGGVASGGGGLRLIAGATLAIVGVAGCVIFLDARPDIFGRGQPAASLTPASAEGEEAHLARVLHLMDVDQIWRREGLTIGALAQAAGMPEHRLRQIVNGVLGFRNFTAFINERRIAAAKTILVDPEHERMPISAVAYDLGFGSLGPFNRAFKTATGVTPTQWRRSNANAAICSRENTGRLPQPSAISKSGETPASTGPSRAPGLIDGI